MSVYENPIIPGFYPDPSICRVGEDYYIVNSSFEFFPGVPLWHSRDLVNWEQQGYILTRESQLPLHNTRTSGGIYAPTLRLHNGRFYLITTNVDNSGNFLVWADRIQGPWSEPIRIDQGGIDPSLFWDEDGKVYYTGTHIDEIGQGIGQFQIDLETGKKLSQTQIIWRGTGGRCPEGPHMYKRDGWYYLLIAEGGTEYGHMVTIARSRNVWGPFESCPRNPILSHRDDICSSLQALGHADMTEDAKGNWWMVFHGIRPTNSQLHHIGRETMIAPMVWDEDGWPLVNGGKSITPVMTVEGDAAFKGWQDWTDDFSGSGFHPRWAWLRNPVQANYQPQFPGLTLTGCADTLSGGMNPTFLGVRQQQFDLRYETEVSLSGHGLAGLTIFHTNEHHYDLCVQPQGNGCRVWLRRQVADMFVESQPHFFENADKLILRVDADKMKYVFFAGTDEEHLVAIGTGSTQLLSTEVMRCTFTGCFAGIFAEGETQASFRYFSAEALK